MIAIYDMLVKISFFIVLAFLFIGFTPSGNLEASKSTRWVICANSSLVVNGSTNLGKFSCVINRYPKTDTIEVEHSMYTNKIALSGRMNMAIAGFDCSNRMMTNELRRTLKQDQFPEINIEFISINGLPELDKHPVALKGWWISPLQESKKDSISIIRSPLMKIRKSI